MTSVRFERFSSNGVSLHAAAAGPTDGPLVLLLHGFPESWRAWERHLPAFARAGFRVVALEQRGYGASDKPRGVKRYRMNELVGDVLGVMDALGSRKAHVVGHDWGAAVAWSTAIRHPDRINRLVVMDVPIERWTELDSDITATIADAWAPRA